MPEITAHIASRDFCFLLYSSWNLTSYHPISHILHNNLTSTYEILLQLLQAPPEPVVVDVHVEIVRVAVARSTVLLGHDHPGFVHHNPLPFWMLGSWLAVHIACCFIVHAIFVGPLGDDHAHVLIRISVFAFIGLYLSVLIEQWAIQHLTPSPSLFPSEGVSFVSSGSLRVDGPSPLSSWRWVLEAGSAPVESCGARFLGGIVKNVSLL